MFGVNFADSVVSTGYVLIRVGNERPEDLGLLLVLLGGLVIVIAIGVAIAGRGPSGPYYPR